MVELFLDSLIPAPYLPKEGRLLDVGSGAGLPGIPLKIQNPRLQTDLLEIRSRKVSFLRQVVRLLKLEGIQVIRGRLEKDRDLLDEGGYHIVTARALAPFSRTIDLCAPLLRRDGVLVGFLGGSEGQDLRESQEAIDKHGLLVEREAAYFLPGKDSERISVILRKRGKSGRSA